MDRRSFIGCLVGLSAARTALAQPAHKIARIGIISSGFTTAELKGPSPDNATIAAFLRGMRERGYDRADLPMQGSLSVVDAVAGAAQRAR
jgi:hypothetical protein